MKSSEFKKGDKVVWCPPYNSAKASRGAIGEVAGYDVHEDLITVMWHHLSDFSYEEDPFLILEDPECIKSPQQCRQCPYRLYRLTGRLCPDEIQQGR